MSLTQTVEKRLAELAKQDVAKTDAIRRAEELADKFSYVKPKTEVPTSDKFYGLPAFSK